MTLEEEQGTIIKPQNTEEENKIRGLKEPANDLIISKSKCREEKNRNSLTAM